MHKDLSSHDERYSDAFEIVHWRVFFTQETKQMCDSYRHSGHSLLRLYQKGAPTVNLDEEMNACVISWSNKIYNHFACAVVSYLPALA